MVAIIVADGEEPIRIQNDLLALWLTSPHAVLYIGLGCRAKPTSDTYDSCNTELRCNLSTGNERGETVHGSVGGN